MTRKLIAHDRYTALGVPLPDVETMCKGPCEGVGVVPLTETRAIARGPEWHAAWREKATRGGVDEMGYVFLTCIDCNGTGKRVTS